MFNQLKTRGAKKRQDERAKAVRVALDDEMFRFNKAIREGKEAFLDTFSGPVKVNHVTYDFWYSTGSGLNLRSWAGCNDGTWANLLRQVGEPRSSLFAD